MLHASQDTSSAERHSHQQYYEQCAQGHSPAPSAAAHTPSMLVDMTLPRPIPAETALRMVRKIVQTLMYTRGQMGSTWEQLEFLLNQEKMRQEFEEQEQDQSFHSHDPHLGTFNHDSLDQDDENDFVVPTKSLTEFLETSEKMFVDLEESIYDQLYSDLRQTATTAGPTQRPRYISLALVFGTTFTTPKEQYMIRLGPLEPRHLSATSTRHNHVASPITTPEQQREEKKWERVLVQELMGIHIIPAQGAEPQQGHDSLSATVPLRHRTKAHLLMKAPAGRIFTGIFPQQQVLLHEDYPTPSASITSQDQQEEERSATQSCWSQGSKGFRGSKKLARWPIHHLHLFGPSAVVSEQDSYHANNNGDDDDNDDDEMWYLIGPGIPILSPLL
ncbi:hypothetical protein BGZ95_011412 [Linnemannia exigua]|uniref:Uncharacterized protein n=1 Tax=Linnemannia exigua TaxID=604196 RepID=A0AAD4H5N3_9FUNG|nr:hypothetical protein BGZ95_011412 [Linnemannia exigua]